MASSPEESDDDYDPQEVHAAQKLLGEEVGTALELQGKKEFVNDQAALKQKEEDLQLPEDYGWVETLDTSCAPVSLEDVNDDQKREAAFYGATLMSVELAINRLESDGIPHLRPPDFFAEMIKPDDHMARIKARLLLESKKMAVVDNRKKLREQKKFAKSVQSEKLKQRAKEKKEHMDQLKSFRKGSKHNELRIGGGSLDVENSLKSLSGLPGLGKLGEGEGDGESKESESGDVKDGQTNRQKGGKLPQKSRKRKAKDAKFGGGGKKAGSKKNDAKSAKSMKDFNIGKNNALPKGFSLKKTGFNKGGKGKGKSGKGARPGKQRRQKQRGGKK